MLPRRVWGALVLVAGLALALVVPAVSGQRVSGTAGRAPIPGQPQVGDCLTAPYVGAGAAVPVAGITLGAAPYDRCPGAADGRRVFGEVVLVAADLTSFPTVFPAVGGGRSPPPDPSACAGALRAYLGWTATSWDPVFDDTLVLLGPGAAQYADGQRWIACAVITGDRGYPVPVRAGAFGRAADLYQQCADSRLGPRSRVRCDDPHDVEVFGTAVIGPDGQGDLADTCARLITARTGLADPTAGGLFEVRAGPDDPNTVPPDVSASGQEVICAIRVTAGRPLAASLVGVAGRPLPWN